MPAVLLRCRGDGALALFKHIRRAYVSARKQTLSTCRADNTFASSTTSATCSGSGTGVARAVLVFLERDSRSSSSEDGRVARYDMRVLLVNHLLSSRGSLDGEGRVDKGDQRASPACASSLSFSRPRLQELHQLFSLASVDGVNGQRYYFSQLWLLRVITARRLRKSSAVSAYLAYLSLEVPILLRVDCEICLDRISLPDQVITSAMKKICLSRKAFG